IRRELDNLPKPPVEVEDRVVRGFDPDNLAALAEALVLRRLIGAAVEVFPKPPILGALLVSGVDEHAVMLASDLVEPVSEKSEEILVCCDHGSVELELDDCLRAPDRLDLPEEIRVDLLLARDVGGELDHLKGSSPAIENRVVRSLDPHLLPILADAL